MSAQSTEPSTAPLSPGARAIAAVRAMDPRFAEIRTLADIEEDLAGRGLSGLPALVAGSWMGPVPTFGGVRPIPAPAWLDPGTRLVEVHLVSGCASVSADPLPDVDPCDWRHSWLYRVLPTGEVVLLYEDGAPDVPQS